MPLLKYGSSLKSLDKSANENVIKANLLYKQFEIQKSKVKKRAKTRIRKRKSPNELLLVDANNTHRDF